MFLDIGNKWPPESVEESGMRSRAHWEALFENLFRNWIPRNYRQNPQIYSHLAFGAERLEAIDLNDVQTLWFTQRLDHFNRQEICTWQQVWEAHSIGKFLLPFQGIGGLGGWPPGPHQPHWRRTPPSPTNTQGAKIYNRKSTLDPNLHYPCWTPGTIMYLDYDFLCKKCITS